MFIYLKKIAKSWRARPKGAYFWIMTMKQRLTHSMTIFWKKVIISRNAIFDESKVGYQHLENPKPQDVFQFSTTNMPKTQSIINIETKLPTKKDEPVSIQDDT